MTSPEAILATLLGPGVLEGWLESLEAHLDEAALLRRLMLSHSEPSFAWLDVGHDRVWEKLNTGHWQDVDVVWRQLYALISLMKVRLCLQTHGQITGSDERAALIRDTIKLCDIGALMGYPIGGNLCGQLASRLARTLNCGSPRLDSIPAPTSRRIRARGRAEPLPVCQNLAIDEFVSRFQVPQRSVLISGAMADWPALSGSNRWDLAYLRQVCGHRTVPVEIGRKYTDADWTQTLMTVNEFIDEFILAESPRGVGYLAQHQLLDQISELRADIVVPDYCHTGEADEVDINMWFGPKDTISPLHTDPKHNLLCQVTGRKFVRIYHADQTPFLYPFDDFLLSNTSQVDLEQVDWLAYPAFKEAHGFEAILEPGDMIYIPPKCWHFVQSLSSPSVSLSFWFQ